MKLLIVGNGGREHALAWKLSQSKLVTEVFVAPGNAGTRQEPKVSNIPICSSDIEGLYAFAHHQGIDLTIVGPEVPLANGIVDRFKQHHLACFGPTQQAAQLECSKVFAKDFLYKYNIPTAGYRTFTDLDSAFAYAQTSAYPQVLKVDGLAAGKGVLIAQTVTEATDWLIDVFKNKRFGSAGHTVFFEDYLVGEEASFIIMTDGTYFIPLPTAQDHKTRDNGDTGPNTGGMGAYCPTSVITPRIQQRVIDQIINPTLIGLKNEGITYIGFLYVGLMIDSKGNPHVLEFNCRLGDPETQVIMMRIESDLLPVLYDCLNGKLANSTLEINTDSVLTVTLCTKGYPDEYPMGQLITGIPDETPQLKVFHGGTRMDDHQVFTQGGRVLNLTVRDNDLQSAQNIAYDAISRIHWDDLYYRTDIGYKEMIRLAGR